MSERDIENDAACIGSEQELRALHAPPSDLVKRKCVDRLDRHCRDFIALSPFLVLGTANAAGKADVSPRGDPPGFVKVLDDTTLLIPDRPGNNLLDSLSNILANPEVGLLFVIPGFDETLRVNGRAAILADPALLASFAVNGKPPRCVLRITVEKVFFQCSRAMLRSKLWDAASMAAPGEVPTAGEMLAAATAGEVNAASYDATLPERLRAGLY